MNKWDYRFITMAKLIASWSKHPRIKVGAVIVDDKQRIRSTGFNGAPRGVNDDFFDHEDRDVRLMRCLHAEENALLFTRDEVTNMTMYITHPPCAKCAAHIIQSGISRVVHPIPSLEFMDKWAKDMKQAKLMFDDVGMIITMIGDIK